MLKISHCIAGFFSNCSVRLDKIIKYFNEHQKLPEFIDDSEMFHMYKPNEFDSNKSIVDNYFIKNNEINIEYKSSINYYEDLQFSNYNILDMENIIPFIRKYFTPTQEIYNIIENIEKKYSLNDYNNICCLFYRGNDKKSETELAPYSDYIERAQKILQKNPNIRFLIQSDETEFIETMINKFPLNSFYFKDETRHINHQWSTVDLIAHSQNRHDINYYYSKYFLAITFIMGKCNDLICISGNCSIWIALFRGNNKNFQQFFEGRWIENGNMEKILKVKYK